MLIRDTENDKENEGCRGSHGQRRLFCSFCNKFNIKERAFRYLLIDIITGFYHLEEGI